MTRLLIEEPPLQVLPSLAQDIGLEEAVILQQLHWMLGREHALEADGRRWIKADYDYWLTVFPFMKRRSLERVFGELRKLGLVESKRGREKSVWTINYLELESRQTGGSTAATLAADSRQSGGSSCKREEEEEEAGDHSQLFATPGASPSKPVDADLPKIERVWAHWLAVFGDRMAVKGMTPPREKALRAGLKAVEGDDGVMIRAIDGYKQWRDEASVQKAPDLSAVFSTGMHDRQNLTDKISSYASRVTSESHGVSGMMSGIPSALQPRVRQAVVEVINMTAQPDLTGVQERGERALSWLRASIKKTPVIEDGGWRGWEAVE